MRQWEYKAIKFEADGRFTGVINDAELENTLNDLAAKGWRLVSIITSNQLQGSTRDIVAVMERSWDE